MTTTHIKYDAVKYVQENSGCVLLHVTNNKGVMGSGIAKQIKHTFPKAFESYKNKHELGEISGSKEMLPYGCNVIINMTAQDGYGRGKKFLNSGALSECLYKVRSYLHAGAVVVIPKNMGANRAGGDWDNVLELVEWYFKDYDIVICEWEG